MTTHGPQMAQDGRTAAKGYQTAIGQGGGLNKAITPKRATGGKIQSLS